MGLGPCTYGKAKCCQQKWQFALELLLCKPAIPNLGQSMSASKELIAGSAPIWVLMHFSLSFCKIVLCFYFSYSQENVQDSLVGIKDQISFPDT